MSFFKILFGQKDKVNDDKSENTVLGINADDQHKKLQEDLTRINSGEPGKIYPILKAGDWSGIKAGAIRQTIIGDKNNPKLLVGFAYDEANKLVFLKYSDYQEKEKLQEMVEQAYKNLDQCEVTFKEVVPKKVLIFDGQEFCSEKILDHLFMKSLQNILGGEKLVVSIPRRRCMMVTNSFEEQDIFDMFLKIHSDTWNNDSYGNPQIMNSIFVLKNGEIEMVKDL